MIRRRLFRQGNSTVVALPLNYLDYLQLKPGDHVDLHLNENAAAKYPFILLAPASNIPPTRWNKPVHKSVDKSMDK